jgi:hypothetical protein
MTKADRGHEVPLSKSVLLILNALKPRTPGQDSNKAENDYRSMGEYVFQVLVEARCPASLKPRGALMNMLMN